MKLKLPAAVCSPQDLETLLLEIRDYAKWFSHAAIKQRVSAGKITEQPTVSPATAEMLTTWAGKKQLTQDSLDELIAELQDFRSAAPRLSITLAAPAHGELKRTLAAWCRDNIEPNILVTFDFNSTLLGGMVVRYGSRIFDWSFRRQIMAQRNKFPEVLRNV